MERIYAELILNDLRHYPSIPDTVKDGVNMVLIEYVKSNKITSEKYTEITGKSYVA